MRIIFCLNSKLATRQFDRQITILEIRGGGSFMLRAKGDGGGGD